MDVSFDKLPQEVSNISSQLDRIEKLLIDRHEQIPNEDEIFGISGAAEFLGLTIPTIYSKVSQRDIPFMKKNGRLYFIRKELVDYVKSGRVKTRQEAVDDAHLHLKPKMKGG